jgi:F-type H+-transporting ATPase subunit b
MASEGDQGTIPWNDLTEAIVNFILFVGLLYYFGKGPVAEFMKNRSDTIGSEIAAAKRLREEAEAELAEYRGKLEQFDRQREEILEGYVKAGESEAEALVEAAREHAERLKRDAEISIQQEIIRARTALSEEIVQDALSVARQTIRERLDDGMKAALVKDYTVSLGKMRKPEA